MPRISLMPDKEIGQTGLAVWNGQVSEAYSNKLTWPGAYSIYDEMRRRDPTIRTMWNATVMLSRTASWYFEPRDAEDPDDQATAEFLEDCLEGMSHTVHDAIEDAMSSLLFGWAWAEIVYARRDDGRIGWKKWAPRRQSSFDHWIFDDEGGLHGFVQRPAPDYREIEIPIEKSLHFTWQRDGTNPEGFALLESLYETWHYLKNLQILNGIGWQRTFVGLPVFELEESVNEGDEAKVRATARGLIVDEQQYVLSPKGINFRLESASNAGAETLLKTIQHYRLLMLQSLLADFIALGSSGRTGSFALGSDKSKLFLMAVDGMLNEIANVINQYGVQRLLDLNPDIRGQATLKHTKVEKPDMGGLSEWLREISTLLTWTDEDEDWLRQRIDMPELPEDVDEQPDDEQSPELPFKGRGQGLVELQEGEEPGDPEARATLEARLRRGLQGVLNEQEEWVTQTVVANPDRVNDPAFWSEVEGEFQHQLLREIDAVVLDAVGLAVDAIREGTGGGEADWALVNTDAMRWAREYVGEAIEGINDTTKDAVQEAVAHWIEIGAPLGELEDTLEALPAFDRQRAELIASTEVTRAYDEAGDLARQNIGLPRTEFHAPAHPRCRCSTHARLLDDDTWVVVWYTAMDERVCVTPVDTPWGVVNGCRDLNNTIVGGPDELLGEKI